MIFPFCDTKKGLYWYYIIQQFKSTFKPLLEITQEKCGKNIDVILFEWYFNDKTDILMEKIIYFT